MNNISFFENKPIYSRKPTQSSMEKEILFVSRNANRGGAIYEDQIKKILEKSYNVDILDLDPEKNKIYFFKKLQYHHQIRSFKPKKEHEILITNRAGVYAGVLKRKFNKSILVLHHYASDENRYPVIRTILKNRFLSKLKSFDTIVVVADFWKKYLEQYVEPQKIEVINNSFDVNEINKNLDDLNKKFFKRKYGIPGDKIIVYAGPALKVKGYQEVVKQLNAEKYFVITTGDKEDNVNHLHLKLDYKEYIQLLATADITVILSRLIEGWNRIAHESLLCGTPVIGTNKGGFGELLNNANQIIYSEGDNLEDLINKSITNKNLITSGQLYASKFDVKYFTERWETIINKSIDNLDNA